MTIPSRRAHAASLLLIFLALPAAALADRLVMTNGDVITGTISKISDGDVYIEPSYADEFAVSLSEVASIENDKILEIELKDGTEVEGQFAGTGVDGEQVMLIDGSPMSVNVANLAQAEEPAEWYDRVSHAELNTTINSGNTDSRNALIFADTRLKLGEHRHMGDITIRRDETDGESTKKQDLLRYEYNWMFNEPWYTGVTATYERDPIRDLDHRYSLAGIIGRDLIDDANRFLEVTYQNGDKEILYYKDFSSGAMIENVVRRAKKLAIKRVIGGGAKGVCTDDLLASIKQEYKEHEDLPNTTNPDDWAKISGKKGERITYVRTLITGEGMGSSKMVDGVSTGQYL